MLTIIEWLEKHQLPCFYKKYLGIECPGCGMQTAFIELLKGHLMKSLEVYPALIPMMWLIIYLIAHIIFKFKNGAKILKYSYIFTIFIVLINYIYKIIKFL